MSEAEATLSLASLREGKGGKSIVQYNQSRKQALLV